jgi:hypothetical protein
MTNDPELNGKYLGTITTDFVKIADTLKEAAYQMKARKISDFPIFILCKELISLGKLLFYKDELKRELPLEWNYYFSYLEEFVERKLVTEVADFKANYKNIDEFACLFVVDKEFVNFVYIPYPVDDAIDDFYQAKDEQEE